jgi:hypothetical protein
VLSAKPQAVEVGGELDAVGAPTPGLVTSVNQWFENAEITTVLNQAVGVIDEDYVSDNGKGLALVVDLLIESLSPGEYVSESEAALADSGLFAATGEYDLRPLGDDVTDYGEGDDLLVDVLAESVLGIPL